MVVGVVVVVVWYSLPIIEPPQLTLFNSVLDWVVAINLMWFTRMLGALVGWDGLYSDSQCPGSVWTILGSVRTILGSVWGGLADGL